MSDQDELRQVEMDTLQQTQKEIDRKHVLFKSYATVREPSLT